MTSFGVLSSRALETRDGTTRRELIHRLLSKKPRDLARVIRSMMYHHNHTGMTIGQICKATELSKSDVVDVVELSTSLCLTEKIGR